MRFSARTRTCRIVFCVCCLLPTLLVSTAAIVFNTPAYRASILKRWQSELSHQLGLEVEFVQLERNAQNEVVVCGITLHDPESHILLARARSATMTRIGDSLVVQLGQPELTSRHLARLTQVLHEHLLLRSSLNIAPFQLESSTLLLQNDKQSESLLDVRVVLDVDAEGTEVLIAFRPAGTEKSEQARLRLVRNRQLDPPATGWELHTGPDGLPCQLAWAWLPELESLGTTCSFGGSIWSEQQSTGWEAELSGVLRQVDLDSLITGHFPHKLSGMAEVTLSRTLVHQGLLEEVAGHFESPGGVISQTLLTAAEEHLELMRHTPSPQSELVAYREMAFDFSLAASGLTISGCQDQRQTVLSDAQGPLLASFEGGVVPIHALLPLLVPARELQVPAARETSWLIPHLPLPTVKSSPTATSRPGYAPLKLRR